MWEDPVVEETREWRRQITHQFGEDVHAFFEYIRKREKDHPGGVVTFPPNLPAPHLKDVPSR